MVLIVMATYVKAPVWVIEHCRDSVSDVAHVTPCGHVEDVGVIIVVKVGCFEFKLHHPLAREAWKRCQEGILLHFKLGVFFKDWAPTWI